jgi:hypothetical protein
MIREFTITPQVFARSSYRDAQDYARSLKEIYFELKRCGVVRNLRDGRLHEEIKAHVKQYINSNLTDDRTIPGLSRLLANLLRMEERFFTKKSCLSHEPECESDWFNEGIASDNSRRTYGYIVSPAWESAGQNEQQVNIASSAALSLSDWWAEKTDTWRVSRKADSLIGTIEPLLIHSKEFVYVDRYFRPNEDRYEKIFSTVIKKLQNSKRMRSIEFFLCFDATKSKHSGGAKTIAEHASEVDFEINLFLSKNFPKLKLKLIVYVFEESSFRAYAHDRFVDTNHGVWNLSNGLEAALDEITISLLQEKPRDDFRRSLDVVRQSPKAVRLEFPAAQ